MKRYTVKAFTIESKWIEYDTDSRAKAMVCASNIECVRVYDNKVEGEKSPILIHKKGSESYMDRKYLIKNFPKAARNLRLV